MRRINSWDEYFMRMVYLISQKSYDPRTKIGAVLVKDNHCIATGFNGFPIGIHDLQNRYNNRQLKLLYVAHAERNAIDISARLGICTLGSTLYVQGVPCNECAKSIIQAGINKIVIHQKWPIMSYSKDWINSTRISNIMFKEAKIKIIKFNKFLDLITLFNGKEIIV